jgi:glycosyltransferase involved in cell wall biosynthesis
LKLLYLSSWFPFPPDNGSRQRAFHLLRGLAARHEIVLVALTDADQRLPNTDALEEYCSRVATLQRATFQPRGAKALAALVSSQPRSLVDTFDPMVHQLIQTEFSQQEFDLILAGELGMAAYAKSIEHPAKIFDDVEAGIFADAYQQATGAARLRNGLTWFKFMYYLKSLAREFSALTVVSWRERDLLAQIGIDRNNVRVIPNGIDCTSMTTDITPDTHGLIYNGSLTYSANLDAMRFFVRDILPLIRTSEPRAHLCITGRADQVAINELSVHNSVSFSGYVPDVRSLVQRSSVCVVPLRVGGGTRVKILEAMALGTAVVSTSKGAEGLNVQHGEHLLIADTPHAFAEATVRLLQDVKLREQLTKTARQHVCQEYDWRSIVAQLDELIAQVAHSN